MKLIVLTFLFTLLPITQAPAAPADTELKIDPNIPVPKSTKKCSGYDLFQAVSLNQKSCVLRSMKNMDIDERNEEGETPLQVAIRKRAYLMVALLVKKGADLNKQNYRFQTARGLADELGERGISDFLEKIEWETDRLYVAIENNDLKAVAASLHRGASIGTRDIRLDTPLHRAAQSGFTQVAELLIKKGAPVNSRNYLGETPLHSATMRGFTPFVELLLKNGADINAEDERRQTPLDLAQTTENPALSRLLDKYKAQHGSPAQVSLDITADDGQNTDYFPQTGAGNNR